MASNNLFECLIPGYHITEQLSEGQMTLLYRGYRHHDRESVLLQVLRPEYCLSQYIAQFKEQFEYGQALKIDGVVKPIDLVLQGQAPTLVLQDIGGELWYTSLQERYWTIESVLDIAITLADLLIKLHAQQFVHQQIQPHNVLIQPQSGQVQLLLAQPLDLLSSQNLNEPYCYTSLAYISPEQTGRMNNVQVDTRSDFYNLGITLYQAFTGVLPFQSRDLNELIHSHIARSAPAPDSKDKEIPESLSRILLKLLAKSPEERYQSAYGLKSDLVACLQAIRNQEELDDFAPGQTDLVSELSIPQRLYDRQHELDLLLQSYARVCQGQTQTLLITGESGVGKSLLVREFQNQLINYPGCFIRGQCDAVRRDVPYLALNQAFQGLFCQLLMEDEPIVQSWRQRILHGLGDNAELLCEVLPELVQIIGRPPKGPDSQVVEAENRLNQAFQALVRVLATPEHPLVLFVDDLQWLDAASVKLLEHLLTQENSLSFLLVAACRIGGVRVSQNMDLRLIRNLISGEGRHEVVLSPFTIHQMQRLVADVLHAPLDSIQELAELIFSRTQGNPFFAHQLLEFLYQEKLLVFNFDAGQWSWDLEQIRHFGVTENVVELMEQKILKLSPQTRDLLQMGACIGIDFDVEAITQLSEMPATEIPQALGMAVQEGLIIPLTSPDSSYQGPASGTAHFQFLHDRVRQTVYALIPEASRQKFHWQIGQRLLQQMFQQRQDDSLFEVVNQLNLGRVFIKEAVARQELAHLNLKASQRAKQSAAYESALQYILAGISMLAQDSWEKDYNLTRDLWLEQAECQYLCGSFPAAATAFQELEQNLKTVEELADMFTMQMVCAINQNQYQTALDLGRLGLSKLDVEIPEVLDESLVLQLINDLRQKLIQYSPAYFLALPTCENLRVKQILQLLQYFAAASISQDQHLYRWAITTMVNYSIEFGNTDRSAYAYVAYGTILSAGFGEYDRGHQLGQVALELSQTFQAMQGLAHFSYGGLLAHWRISFSECRQHLQTAFQHCQRMGELLYALYTQALRTDLALLGGYELESTQEEIESFQQFAAQRQHPVMQLDATLKLQFVRSLRGLTKDASSFSSGECDEDELYQQLHADNTPKPTRSRYYICKAQSLYLFGYYQDALELSQASAAVVDAHFGPAVVIDHFVFHGLIAAALHDTATKEQQVEYKQIVTDCLHRLQRWSYHCPANFAPRWHLLAAEQERLLGNDPTCHYDEAIDLAQTQGMLQISAIANELAGEYYWKQQHQRIARAYLNDACMAYQQWGATAKASALQQQYRSLLTWRANFTGAAYIAATPKAAVTQSLQTLDWMTVLKASQALSSEIVYSSLLEKLLTILMENAGAERGVLLTRQDKGFVVEAEGNVEQDEIQFCLEPQCPTAENLPINLITYVERTQETILLDEAIHDLRFASDPYIDAHKLKSVLCFPIVYQGKQTGILYLENRLIVGAFTPAQLEVVRLLTSQVSISAENAQLYGDLQQHLDDAEAQNQKLLRSQFQLETKTKQLETALLDLKQTQAQLVQTEKMSGLGQLVAGVAHEVKNPLNFIQGNLEYANQYVEQLFQLIQQYQSVYPEPPQDLRTTLEMIDLDFVSRDLPKLLSSMEIGTSRIQSIVSSLRTFSRTDGEVKDWVNLHEGIEGTLLILRSRFGANADRPSIEIIRDFGNLPLVKCFAGQINQVIMNLVANACDAIDETVQGRDFDTNVSASQQITIQTEQVDDARIAIRVIDNGKGMSAEVQRKIFETFFTTKSSERGTGLGLSISYQIVTERHGGELLCNSEEGHGTTFTVLLPIEATDGQPTFVSSEECLDFIDTDLLAEM